MNDIIDLPKPKIKLRKTDPNQEKIGLEQGLHPLLARILAARSIPHELQPHEVLNIKLSSLAQPYDMADMQKAALRIAKAIINREYIGIETDHDCDGQTSHAVLYYNLSHHFKHPVDKLYSYIGHRLIEGYGLSDSVADRILQDQPLPSLVITADNGSADEPRINRLKTAGIDVIVTDHHEIPSDDYPLSAYACLNPTRQDCNYPDKYIAGCMVAWLLMTAVRQELIARQYLNQNALKLMDSLDFVAVGTVADCVSIGRSKNNRAVVSYGLKLIKKGVRPCWRALKETINGEITAEDLSFKIAPLLNSDGRLATAFGSVSLLLAATDEEASLWVENLSEQNQQRKAIQQGVTMQGLQQAYVQAQENKFSFCIFLENGHVGVHGISASRIKEYFGRPTAFFALKATDLKLITGSIRGIEGFHVRDALQFVADHAPGLLIAFGGHQGAGGATLLRENFNRFSDLFEQAAKVQLQTESLGPVIWTDGELPSHWINLETLEAINSLAPFGREFEQPIFQMQAKLLALNPVGDGTHARVVLDYDGKVYRGIWFGMRTSDQDPIPVSVRDQVLVAYSLKLNEFRGSRSCELQVLGMQGVRRK